MKSKNTSILYACCWCGRAQWSTDPHSIGLAFVSSSLLFNLKKKKKKRHSVTSILFFSSYKMEKQFKIGQSNEDAIMTTFTLSNGAPSNVIKNVVNSDVKRFKCQHVWCPMFTSQKLLLKVTTIRLLAELSLSAVDFVLRLFPKRIDGLRSTVYSIP